MSNKDLIIKIVRRLAAFTLDEVVVISELPEEDVSNILTELLKERIISKSNDTYYFENKNDINNTRKSEDEKADIKDIKPIIMEQEEDYDYYLTLCENARDKIKRYVELINVVLHTGNKNLKQVVRFFNETSGYKRIPLTTFRKVLYKYRQHGFKGLLPPKYDPKKYNVKQGIPDELYNCFKKYYLNKNKLYAVEAVHLAQIELEKEQKMEQPYTFNAKSFLSKLRAEFTEEQIEYFRNNIKPSQKTKIKSVIKALEFNEPLDMLFKDAAKIYFKRLKESKHEEKFLHENTNYKNHLKDYFDSYQIREITNKTVAEYKQKKFNDGYQLSSVNYHIVLLKKIIKSFCPKMHKLAEKGQTLEQNSYALDMNILSEEQIISLLKLCHKKYSWAYPILYISLSTGASVPELLALTWENIDFEEHTINLKCFLYGTRLILNKACFNIRILKIDDRICEILKSQFDKLQPKTTDFVFYVENDTCMQHYFEKLVLTPLSSKLEIPKFSPSDLQHNFVNICLKQNIPVSYIQKSIGCYSLVTFVKTYSKLIQKYEEETYYPFEKLNLF